MFFLSLAEKANFQLYNYNDEKIKRKKKKHQPFSEVWWVNKFSPDPLLKPLLDDKQLKIEFTFKNTPFHIFDGHIF